jgi:hypothetical protein
MTHYARAEHRVVAAALRSMDAALLLRCRCWFGGGTAIVLDLGEYRLSRDIDFLCADVDGYRELRARVGERGASALFGPGVSIEREVRTDQYGIRGIVAVSGVPLRFEVVREARIQLSGAPHPSLGIPLLAEADQAAEKLLANADRGRDRAAAFRDAIDLGMIALRRGAIPAAARDKAEAAYGAEVQRVLAWVLSRLAEPAEARHAADTLSMPLEDVAAARDALRDEAKRLWP